MQYRSEIDGLRALAVVPVILFHAGFEAFSGGFVGVDVFFVISGYLITSILIGEIEAGRFSLVEFYERRARRILPALFAVMLACVPFAWAWMPPDAFRDFAQSLVAVSVFASNFLFWEQSGYFDRAAEEKPLLHTWSLAVEEQYYLLFPLLLVGLWRFGRAPVFWTIVALSAVSLALSEWGWRTHPSANFFLAPFRAWELFAGSLAAFVTRRHGVGRREAPALAGLAAILLAVFAYDATVPFPSLWALLPVGGTVLVLLFGGAGTLAARLLGHPVPLGIGLISYSAYLWHQPLFAFARIHPSLPPPGPAGMLVLSLAALGLGALSWRYVERPFRVRRGAAAIGRRTIFAAGLGGMAAFAAGGLAIHLTDGVPARMSPDTLARQAEIDDLTAQRNAAIAQGRYHFNRRGEHRTLQAFLANWSRPPATGAAPRLAVFGDSHAADKAAALRAAGYDVTQMTASGCPLLPSRQPRYCDQLRARLHEETAPATTVLLANRYFEEERTPAYLQRVVDYWAARYGTVVLFTPMPEFDRFGEIYAFTPERAARHDYDPVPLAMFHAAMAQVDLPETVVVIDTRELFCGRGPGCPLMSAGPRLIDYGHLSPAGAESVGRALVAELAARGVLPK